MDGVFGSDSRAELAGEIERTHEALGKMVLDLENLHATIFRMNAHASASVVGFSVPSFALGHQRP
jgi:hypothetical protein